MDAVLPMPGTYVLAVSGGVDSMALLHHMHTTNPGEWKLVVAHLDHGIRDDSHEDRRLVQGVTQEYGLPFVYHEAALGAGASEATARQARYDFLRDVQRSSKAQAIVTAHHQDDLLETAIINLLRGTGRKGLTSLQSHDDIVRPLLAIPKTALITYAKDQGLLWREDSTNSNESYLRNYIRAQILPRFDEASREQLLLYIKNMTTTNQAIDDAITGQLDLQSTAGALDRQWFNHLPHAAAKEVLASWLRAHNIRDFDRGTLERLVIAAKTSFPSKQYPISKGNFLEVRRDILALKTVER